MTVRAARPEDEPALRSIDLATWTSDVSPGPTPSPDASFFAPGSAVEDVLVAPADGAVAGYVRLVHPTTLPSHRHALVVNGLAVDPARQREGFGRALMEAAVAEARARGARKLSLRVLDPNAAARRLYERCGFVVEGVLAGEFRLHDTYVDDVLMARDLTLPG